jgi:hypothetical protein
MLKFKTSVIIRCPIETVFAFVSNFENEPQYQKEVEKTIKITEGPIGVGTTFRDIVKVMGRRLESEYQIIEFEPSRKLAIKILKGQAPYTARLTFEEVEEGTRLDFDAYVYPTGWLKLAQPLLQPLLQKQFEGNYTRLKRLLEQQS